METGRHCFWRHSNTRSLQKKKERKSTHKSRSKSGKKQVPWPRRKALVRLVSCAGQSEATAPQVRRDRAGHRQKKRRPRPRRTPPLPAPQVVEKSQRREREVESKKKIYKVKWPDFLLGCLQVAPPPKKKRRLAVVNPTSGASGRPPYKHTHVPFSCWIVFVFEGRRGELEKKRKIRVALVFFSSYFASCRRDLARCCRNAAAGCEAADKSRRLLHSPAITESSYWSGGNGVCVCVNEDVFTEVYASRFFLSSRLPTSMSFLMRRGTVLIRLFEFLLICYRLKS